MARVFNFSAGPATMPQEVLEQVRDELLDWRGAGMSIMEMSHRGPQFMAVAAQAEADLRELLAIPDNYRVLFLQGGAATQFAAVPLNLMGDRDRADYINSGHWSQKAMREAGKYLTVNEAAASDADFTRLPEAPWRLDPQAAYVHYTPNETIHGLEFHHVPEVGEVPLVADMSSSFLSRPVDVSRFGVIYAGAQKNAGPAGVTVVIVRDDLMGRAHRHTPMTLDYAQQAAAGSMLNTPASFNWYVCGLIFQWLKRQGGLDAMAEMNARKAGKLYDLIDASDFYACPVAPEARSRMNVRFTLAEEGLNAAFLEQAEAAGLAALRGHRALGGMRASIYNAMPETGVDALVAFMREFERNRA